MTLGAVIVGAGLMGRWHADAVTNAGHRVIAIADPDRARAENLASALGVSVVVASLDDLAASLRADVVHICSPTETHYAVATSAIERGMHALVEKPLTGTAAETEELLSIAHREHRMVMPVHQFLFQRGVSQLSEAIRAAPGSLLHLDMVACTAGATGRDAVGHDEVASSVLPHALSLARRLTGTTLHDAEWSVLHPEPGELRCATVLNGRTISLLVSTSGRPPSNSVRAIMRDCTIDVDLFHGYAVSITGSTSRAFKIMRPFVISSRSFAAAGVNGLRRLMERERAYPGLRELVRRFYVAAASGGSAPISDDETLDVALIRDRIEAAVRGMCESERK